MNLNKLTPDEEAVMLRKGTEPPFSGKYDLHFDDGAYLCRHCSAMLYWSKDKFDAHCGWPSFDDEVNSAIKRIADADGLRTEIVCSNCNAHLGHVFVGENLTKKDTRHCVNSISLDFVPKSKLELGRAIFAGGCFWGVEYHFRNFPGVLDILAGYTGGHKDNPTYDEVCSGNTGHVEAVEVIYDPARVSYDQLARLFFEIHDPTQVSRQGPDIGEQYSSIIFYADEGQKRVAEKLIVLLKKKGLNVATELRKAGRFWKAEDYHQDYYGKKGGTPYCHVYVKRF